ncbi:MAG: hypothetical protein K6A89_02310 [Treponema sp.]|nr:hypothetical protein [Treponema sp.]
MKKNTFLAATILTACVLTAGCASNQKSENPSEKEYIQKGYSFEDLLDCAYIFTRDNSISIESYDSTSNFRYVVNDKNVYFILPCDHEIELAVKILDYPKIKDEKITYENESIEEYVQGIKKAGGTYSVTVGSEKTETTYTRTIPKLSPGKKYEFVRENDKIFIYSEDSEIFFEYW